MNDLAKQSLESGLRNPRLMTAALALSENRLADAEPLLRAHLGERPTDVAAIRLMAELAARVGRVKDSETLLRRALELAPDFGAARSNLATILYKQHRFEDALDELNQLIDEEGDNPEYRNLKAAALGRTGGYDEALELYGELTTAHPDHAKLWMSYGHMLKTVGRQEDSIAAYRRSIDIQSGLGETWWSLANLMTHRFSDSDVAAMEAALADAAIDHEDRFHLHFALGKAYEDRGDPAQSFGHYAEGNRLRCAELAHDPLAITRNVDRTIATFTHDFVADRAGQGSDASDPIFILGMPRAGSTLIEQILSSHSMIEGTMELPDMPAIAGREGRDFGGAPDGWLKAVEQMPPERLAELGQEFLDRTAIQRKSDKPYYIDKLPNNWMYVGLIHMILPNAKIIDARRHPLDCCFSNFRQHFARGQSFSYSLEHMGSYYTNYVRAMAHFDTVLPGRIHRVIHEALLDDPETEVRALLDYLDLPFEDGVMRFHENARAVRTASSEQVRRPLNRDGVDQWRPYEQWLDPLKETLGPVLERYPAAPF